jgi:phospholipid/cholesterol/gamma-HCH transport system ATP-binding protein
MTSKTEPLASFVDLHLAFGKAKVLKGITLDLKTGVRTFVVGPSGTGKSVLFKCLVGFLQPTSGEIYYGGEGATGLRDAQLTSLRKRCSYVFQHPALFDSMTVAENVELVVEQHFPSEDPSQRAKEVLALVGMEGKGELAPMALAGGEQKLVSIARALAMRPETLILDEPTTGLDPGAARSLDQSLVALMKRGQTQTIIVVSHDLRSIRLLADEVVMLLDGRVHFQGSADEFFSSSDEQVSRFVSA